MSGMEPIGLTHDEVLASETRGIMVAYFISRHKKAPSNLTLPWRLIRVSLLVSAYLVEYADLTTSASTYFVTYLTLLPDPRFDYSGLC